MLKISPLDGSWNLYSISGGSGPIVVSSSTDEGAIFAPVPHCDLLGAIGSWNPATDAQERERETEREGAEKELTSRSLLPLALLAGESWSSSTPGITVSSEQNPGPLLWRNGSMTMWYRAHAATSSPCSQESIGVQ